MATLTITFRDGSGLNFKFDEPVMEDYALALIDKYPYTDFTPKEN